MRIKYKDIRAVTHDGWRSQGISNTKRGDISYNWRKQGSKDIRDVISLGKLLRKGDGPEQIEGLVKTLAKYANDTDDN